MGGGGREGNKRRRKGRREEEGVEKGEYGGEDGRKREGRRDGRMEQRREHALKKHVPRLHVHEHTRQVQSYKSWGVCLLSLHANKAQQCQ